MIRVIEIVSGWGSGGVEKYISNCASILSDSVVFDILAVRGVSDKQLFSEKILNNGGKIFSIPKLNKEGYFQRKKRRKKYIEQHLKMYNYDIVHINGTTADFMQYAKIVKKISPNTKVIMHCHGDSVDAPNVYVKKIIHFINKKLYSRYPDYLLGCSSRTMKWMYTNKSLKIKPNKVIYCGIDTKLFKFNNNERNRIRNKLKVEKRFVVGTIGRICNQKNPYFILKIICELKRLCPHVVFLWIGNGDMKLVIEEKAKELNILDNIIFYGTSSNIPSMLSAMDVFILPSNYEGNPIVGFEAQANGMKCFFSNKIVDESKITQIVEFLSIENSEKEWAQKILFYKNGYKRFDTQSQIIESGYDFKDCAYDLNEIYNYVLKTTRKE